MQRFNSWIQQTFPHPDHRLRSSGFGGGTSSIYAVCALHIAHAVRLPAWCAPRSHEQCDPLKALKNRHREPGTRPPSTLQSLLLQDEDLLVLEFANNDGEGGPTASAIRHLELLVRKLLQLPSRPAVVLLNS